MTRVAVVIPNWNGERWLRPCLDSLRRQTFRDFHVVVVDNGSVDGSLALLRESYPEVQVVANPTNLGFAAAMNIGIRACEEPLVAALNNDTEAHPEWLAALVAEIDRQPPEVGFLASKILDFSDRTVIDSVGDGYCRLGLSYKIGAGSRDTGQFREPFEVLSACAAASLYRREMLDAIGLFDEDFFAYMEDVDLGIRARLAGYRCFAVPEAIVYHVGSATSGGPASPFAIRLTTRNLFALILKTLPLWMVPGVLALALASQGAVLAKSLLTGRPAWLRANLSAYGSGVAAALRELPATLAKRRAAPEPAPGAAAALARLMPLLPKRWERAP
ncbi:MULTISPECIES: glycosyltransferase family 2 protein [Methylobacterium]|uniref:Undecaprenyl-phosphate 4-deoxy-4-formamido-L-arabinose transferase n=1 Tax=Methylobacterium jeotgali TaxID=381630 RepID=A0ABQ4SQT5_9HYPH|nr:MULTISPECIES: glycosyltransferase family 2 protein [Methylobacterium]PIU07039.1 MAG: glycosyltransferase family 2 protein [Methylobacterium sp. CG09_land_8_20_14_0_10_71_15]PIU12244.1 MAG: glycosyltransferase family 2 protein [Methylobacterium sp. CG08_land_8_20_14_0_20_71_15]GBU16726.1 glycosyl transferase [Methylobacterium sp.]GJE05457.1 Undecaprenyl-phosphate 4-deoxy-4-formamido-L-arabinose transferase [Methylobacterium jeotgali]